MKRLIAVISGLLVLPAFAEVAPAYYYEDAVEYVTEEYAEPDVVSDEIVAEEDEEKVVTPVVPTKISPRNSGRAASSRAVATQTNSNVAAGRNVGTRAVSTRTTTTSATNSARTATTGQTISARPSATTRASRASVTTSGTKNVSTRRNAQTNTANTARASIVQTDTVNSPLYRARVGVRSTAGVSSRVPTIRMASNSTATDTTATVTTTDMDELAQITDFCKAQYTQCMDNFCNVLDDNQGRCSCSKNLKNYEKTEQALKQATEDLQDVAQKIQYIGLTSDEVETLFTQTEAELEMQTSSDNTQLKNDLDKIKNMIIDVKTASASATTDSGIGLDLSGLLDFSIDSTGFDLSTLFGNTTNTSSISNQRGEQLYKTASARCKASVLNSCSAQGVDISIITNAYDLEIDKQCIAYERSLTDSNEQMGATVRNAKSVLQKARLLVAQQKNSYDLRGCVNALDTCMQDDFVCGSDYENCLDPSGKYIVNGEIVIGSEPGISGDAAKGALYKMTWSYDSNKNAWSTSEGGGSLSEYIENTVTTSSAQKPSNSMSEFLQNKIGYHDDTSGKNFGMCMSVLNKCQDITYTGTGQNTKYNATNNVIKEYLQRTLIQIKTQQDEVLADYAEECIADVSSCLAQNNYDADDATSNSAKNNIAINACKSIITTCKSVNGDPDSSESSLKDWINKIFSSTTK